MKNIIAFLIFTQALFASQSFFGLQVGNEWYYEYENYPNRAFTCSVIDTFSVDDSLFSVMKTTRVWNDTVMFSDTLFEDNYMLYDRSGDVLTVIYDLSMPLNDSTFEIIPDCEFESDTLWAIKTTKSNRIPFLSSYDESFVITFDHHGVYDEELYYTFIDGIGLVDYTNSDGLYRYSLKGVMLNGVGYGEDIPVFTDDSASFFGLEIGNEWFYEYENQNGLFVSQVIDTFSRVDSLFWVRSHAVLKGSGNYSYNDTLYENGMKLYGVNQGVLTLTHDVSMPLNDSTFQIIPACEFENDTLWRKKTSGANPIPFLEFYNETTTITLDHHGVDDEELYYTYIKGLGLVDYTNSDGRERYTLKGIVVNGVGYGRVAPMSIGEHQSASFTPKSMVTLTNSTLSFTATAKSSWNICSLNGRVLYQSSALKGELVSVNLASLSRGLYIVQIENQSQTFIVK